jgi:hypothetical protein
MTNTKVLCVVDDSWRILCWSTHTLQLCMVADDDVIRNPLLNSEIGSPLLGLNFVLFPPLAATSIDIRLTSSNKYSLRSLSFIVLKLAYRYNHHDSKH